MRMNQKILSIFVALLLVGSLMPMALADDNQFTMLFYWNDVITTDNELVYGENTYLILSVYVTNPVDVEVYAYKDGSNTPFGGALVIDGDWDYSGEIEFIEGEIYYYVGDVFENLQGVMTLDGKGFNPFLDLSASTKIGDAEIILGVFGPFDNPEWRFDSDKGYTESDILQLLTFNTRVAEEGFTTEGLGTQAQTILGAYLERQLERNFIQATGLKSAGLIEGVEISGDLLNPSASEEFAISAHINKSFSFSYKRSFSLEGAYKKKVGVEYKLNPNFSVIGNVDETGNIHMKFRVRRIY